MKNLSPYIIGLDIGTGSIKAVALTSSGQVISSAQTHYETYHPKTSYAEQAPEDIWNAFVTALQTIVDGLRYTPACISLSSCMHSLLLMDADTKPLTNLITWADSRSAAIAEHLRQSVVGEAIYTATGTPLHSMSPLTKIAWFKKENNRVFNYAEKFISIKEFIWYRLFGVFEIDYSVASATGLFDIRKLTWNSDALQFAGIDETMLSTPVSTSFSRTYKDNSNLLSFITNVPFCIGASDGCLANLGVGAMQKGIAAVTIGTSAAVRVNNPQPILDLQTMPFSYVVTEGNFICGAPVNNGGNILGWLQKNFLNTASVSYDVIIERASKLPAGSEGLICLPYLFGERAPVWDERSSGVFLGLKAVHTQDHFLRAALEGICYSLLAVVQLLEEKGIAIQQLNVSGGFVRSQVWMQLLADVTGKPLYMVHTEDASAIGAAILGRKAVGITDDFSPALPKPHWIEPDKTQTAIHKKHYEVFRQLYAALQQPMHQLYSLNP